MFVDDFRRSCICSCSFCFWTKKIKGGKGCRLQCKIKQHSWDNDSVFQFFLMKKNELTKTRQVWVQEGKQIDGVRESDSKVNRSGFLNQTFLHPQHTKSPCCSCSTVNQHSNFKVLTAPYCLWIKSELSRFEMGQKEHFTLWFSGLNNYKNVRNLRSKLQRCGRCRTDHSWNQRSHITRSKWWSQPFQHSGRKMTN